MPLSPDAENELEAFSREMNGHTQEAIGMLAGALGKARGHLLRLATVLEYLRWASVPQASEPTMISRDAVRAAAGLLEGYFLPMAERVFGDAEIPLAERRAMVLARYLKKHALPRFNARDLVRKISGTLRETAAMHAACDVLVGAGLIRPHFTREGRQPGRKAQNYEVNPALRGGAL